MKKNRTINTNLMILFVLTRLSQEILVLVLTKKNFRKPIENILHHIIRCNSLCLQLELPRAMLDIVISGFKRNDL